MDSTFNVNSVGATIGGQTVATVAAKLAQLAKIELSAAQKLCESKQVIKRGLNKQKAHAYKNKLESIGLAVELEEIKPKADQVFDSLSLVPTDEELASSERVQAPSQTGVSEHQQMLCPKCGAKRGGADQCPGCGVYFSKLASSPAPDAQIASGAEPKIKAKSKSNVAPEPSVVSGDAEADTEHYQEPLTESLQPKSIAAGIGVAVAAAFLWQLIAVQFGYELGLVAWLIGGAIGFAVARSGAFGEKAGYFCGALALCAILGGKFLIINSYFSDMESYLTSPAQFIEDAAQQQIAQAKLFVDSVDDDEGIKRFMVDQEYTNAQTVWGVTDEELEWFKQDVEPELRSIAQQGVDTEAMQMQLETNEFDASVQNEFGELSRLDLLVDSLGLIDLIFLFLGVGTAFRLGRGQE